MRVGEIFVQRQRCVYRFYRLLILLLSLAVCKLRLLGAESDNVFISQSQACPCLRVLRIEADGLL